LFYGIAGSLCFFGHGKEQIAYLLPWIWLVLVPLPGDSKSIPVGSFARVWLSLTASWQSLQAFPIAGTQVATATVLLLLAYAVSLGDSITFLASIFSRLRATGLPPIIPPYLLTRAPLSTQNPQRFEAAETRRTPTPKALALAALLYIFVDGWCNLPGVRAHYADLPALELPGSRFVHTDSEITVTYRALTQYLETRCQTFVTYPGINSLYFWTGKRPPTHCNSTGWGQLSYARQEQILAALRHAERPMIVIVGAAVERWTREIPPQISPLVRFIFEDCREVQRIGGFIIYAPKTVVKARPLNP